jgi:hypothetical protein
MEEPHGFYVYAQIKGFSMRIINGVACLCLGMIGGVLGACSVSLMQAHMRTSKILQVRGLEIVDAQKKVRAVLATGNDGSVFLRLLSAQKDSIVDLAVRSGHGTLSFSTDHTNNLIAVGYQPLGDVVDGHDRGMWGISIKGHNHETKGMNVFTEDGMPQGFTVPLTPPQSTSLPR